MASGNQEGLAKLREKRGQTICDACNRTFNEQSDDEMMARLFQIAGKNKALKKAVGEPIPPVDRDDLRSSWKERPNLDCECQN